MGRPVGRRVVDGPPIPVTPDRAAFIRGAGEDLAFDAIDLQETIEDSMGTDDPTSAFAREVANMAKRLRTKTRALAKRFEAADGEVT